MLHGRRRATLRAGTCVTLHLLRTRLASRNTRAVVTALGIAQTIAWASTYYLPAVLATPIAQDLGVSPPWVFAAFSLAMILSAIVGPWGGRRIDRFGGRDVLVVSNVVFALGLALLANTQGPQLLFVAWAIIGLGMGIGLYESAFATLAGIYGKAARSPITGITLFAGFASTVGWPLTGYLEATVGWRNACLVWAGIHLFLALPLNALLPAGVQVVSPNTDVAKVDVAEAGAPAAEPRQSTLYLLAFVFAVTWFCSTAMASHLPRLLEAAGATTAMAIAAGALIGPAQVIARLAEYGLLQRFHPLVSARLAAVAHPVGAAILILVGGPAAYAFALLHGAGNGVLTIAKGTLPLALFGATNYGHRLGILNAPARALQAFAPLLFGFALESFGANAIWFTAWLSGFAFLALLLIRPPKE
jgi:MFS family permease